MPPSWSIAKEGVEPILREARKLRKQFGDDFDSASAALAAWYRANKASPSFMNRRFRFIDKTGVYKEDDPTAPGGRKFDLINPRTGEVIPLRPNRGWGFDQETFNKMVDEGRITFITDTSIMVRRYLHETDRLTPQSVFYQPARSASERLGRLLEAALFDFPKDERIIRQFIDMATDVNDEDCIVMDFFAGSGTTAQAVMDLNRDDGGRRTFLCVQMPEKTSEDSEAFKQGFKTISEVCKKRISTIVNQHLESANGKLEYDRDAPAPGFRSFILNYSNFKQWNAEVIDKDELLKQLEDFKEPLFKKPEDSLDLLTELLLKSGIPLATQTEQRTTSDG
ncbi:MAG TPA: DNA methyltransferase, partial [Pyrinomonadaceae bacterium]|nr:DNA methyltransferase [Pyrinomonadaceae bacterium]